MSVLKDIRDEVQKWHSSVSVCMISVTGKQSIFTRYLKRHFSCHDELRRQSFKISAFTRDKEHPILMVAERAWQPHPGGRAKSS